MTIRGRYDGEQPPIDLETKQLIYAFYVSEVIYGILYMIYNITFLFRISRFVFPGLFNNNNIN